MKNTLATTSARFSTFLKIETEATFWRVPCLEDIVLPTTLCDGVPPHQRSSHGAPVTESPDPSFSMALGCHGSCFANYPGGRATPLCPYFLPAVCIVHGIIFPNANSSLRQWSASEMTVTSLTQERQGKYKLMKGESPGLTFWLPPFVLNVC